MVIANTHYTGMIAKVLLKKNPNHVMLILKEKNLCLLLTISTKSVSVHLFTWYKQRNFVFFWVSCSHRLYSGSTRRKNQNSEWCTPTGASFPKLATGIPLSQKTDFAWATVGTLPLSCLLDRVWETYMDCPCKNQLGTSASMRAELQDTQQFWPNTA